MHSPGRDSTGRRRWPRGRRRCVARRAGRRWRPAPPTSKDARRVYDEATAAFGLGRYAEAAEKYEAAFSLRPDPALLYNAAQSYRLGGQQGARARAVPQLRAPVPGRHQRGRTRAATSRRSRRRSRTSGRHRAARPPVAPAAAARGVAPHAGRRPPPRAAAPRRQRCRRRWRRRRPRRRCRPRRRAAADDANVPMRDARRRSRGEEQKPLTQQTWFWVAVGAAAVAASARWSILLATRRRDSSPTRRSEPRGATEVRARRRSRATARRRSALVALAALAARPATRSRAAGPARVFVHVRRSVRTSPPTRSDIDVSVDGGAPHAHLAADSRRARGRAASRSQFPDGYPAGKMRRHHVTLDALARTTVLAAQRSTVTLDAASARRSTVDFGTADGGAGAGGGGAGGERRRRRRRRARGGRPARRGSAAAGRRRGGRRGGGGGTAGQRRDGGRGGTGGAAGRRAATGGRGGTGGTAGAGGRGGAGGGGTGGTAGTRRHGAGARRYAADRRRAASRPAPRTASTASTTTATAASTAPTPTAGRVAQCVALDADGREDRL